ncbi:hypothetical protein RND81_10G190500 [Saponaria officinalis]|uniref:Uncharacterized protein n=1 Tax=Saponaria officinalis TaxID=3572 RepID=A0AAW1I6E7_SAPOF
MGCKCGFRPIFCRSKYLAHHPPSSPSSEARLWKTTAISVGAPYIYMCLSSINRITGSQFDATFYSVFCCCCLLLLMSQRIVVLVPLKYGCIQQRCQVQKKVK